MDHYRNPRNKGTILKPDILVKGSNQLCGDTIEIFVSIKKGVIKNIKFNGHGCAISMAAASILTEFAKGKKIEFIKNMKNEEFTELLEITLSPVRLKCGLLCLKTLKNGINDYISKKSF